MPRHARRPGRLSAVEPGERIGDWIVESPLGKGGMGAVYLCRNALSERLRAAVKVIEGTRPEDRERFVREVEAIDRIRHPCVVAVKGWGEHAGRLWIAMELVEGEDLRARLDRGPLPEAEAVELVRGLASALQQAHDKGVSHRDVKPANVVLGADGPRLVDFGIARHDDLTRLTAEGLVAGTPAYLAPEAFTAAGPDPVLLDVYALGQLLHEALTGEEAFPSAPGLSSGHQIARLVSLKNEAVALDPGEGFPEPVRACVRAATAPSPSMRASSMAALLALLDGEALPTDGQTFFVGADELEQTPPPAPAVVPSEPLPPPSRPTSAGPDGVATARVALALVLAVGIGAGGAWFFARPGAPPPELAGEPPRLGKVKIEHVTLDGHFDDGTIGGPLRVHKRSIATCYDAVLPDEPTLTGVVHLGFRVTKEGKARDVEVTQSTLASPQVTRCASAALQGIPFPARDAPAQAEVTLRFLRR